MHLKILPVTEGQPRQGRNPERIRRLYGGAVEARTRWLFAPGQLGMAAVGPMARGLLYSRTRGRDEGREPLWCTRRQPAEASDFSKGRFTCTKWWLRFWFLSIRWTQV